MAFPEKKTSTTGLGGAVLECLVSFTIVFLCVGSLPPGINESHYLPKAKHVWDTSFASGNDIFLQSNDSHFLASLLAGNLAKWFELSSVAWICRAFSWVLFCVGWHRLCRAVDLPVLWRPLVLVCWILLVRYGHLAGEWMVGGFEAKSIAYPLALFGLAAVLEERWKVAWVWLGSAAAFHPVVGGWIVISVLAVWISTSMHLQQRKSHLSGLALGFLIAMIGAWPALMGLGSADLEGSISAAQVHSFFRLPHHLCPRTFDNERWLAAGAVFASFSYLVFITLPALRGNPAAGSVRVESAIQVILRSPMGKLIAVAIASVLISLVGWTIDRVGTLIGRYDLVAKIMRFYWFRWSDVAVPLTTSMLLGWWLARFSYTAQSRSTNDVSPRGLALLVCSYGLAGIIGFLHWKSESQLVPPADRWMLQHAGPFPVNWHNSVETDSRLPNRYTDWLAVCDWIRENSPADSLWITPKHQQSFKWYAQRAEVVSWKDVPQDNHSIIEWFRRTEALTQPRDDFGKYRSWETNELISLAKRYQCNWILLDRSYQDKPPLLECKYPINIDNRSFAVFYVSDAVLNSK